MLGHWRRWYFGSFSLYIVAGLGMLSGRGSDGPGYERAAGIAFTVPFCSKAFSSVFR